MGILDRLAAIEGGSLKERLAALDSETPDVRSQIAERKANPPAAAMGDPRARKTSTFEETLPFVAHPIETAKGFGQGMWGGVKALAHPIDSIKADWQTRGEAANRIKERGFSSDDPENLRDAVEAGIPILGPAFASVGRKLNSPDPIERAQGTGEGIALTSGPQIVKGAFRTATPVVEAQVQRYMKVLDPEGKSPEIARHMAEKAIAEKKVMTNPKVEAPAYAEAKASAIDTRTPIENRANPAPADPIINDLKAARMKLFDERVLPDGTVERTVRHGMQDRVNGISALIEEIEGKTTRVANSPRDVGTINNQTLANLHQDLNYQAGKQGMFEGDAVTNPDRWTADMHGVKAVREAVNSDPASAAANAEKSKWIKAKSLKPREVKEITGKDFAKTAGRLALKSAATGAATAVAGPAAGKLIGGLVGGGEILKIARTVMDSPKFQTWSAVNKARFAEMMNAGDVAGATKLAAQLGIPLSGEMTPEKLAGVLRGAVGNAP